MNQQLLNKILGEFKEKFEDGTGITMCCECGIDIEKLKFFLVQSLTTAYQAGQDDLKNKLLEGMVEHKPHLGSENQDEYVAFSNGYNECCEEIIKLLEKI